MRREVEGEFERDDVPASAEGALDQHSAVDLAAIRSVLVYRVRGPQSGELSH